jgi:hypothetical protein
LRDWGRRPLPPIHPAVPLAVDADAVPELTRIADIKFNERVSLPRDADPLSSLNEAETLTRHLHCATDGESGRRAIRDQEPDQIIDLEKQYEELCRLREQVRKAELRRNKT